MAEARLPSTKILARQGARLRLELTDLVSVFDWGPLGQPIPQKGLWSAKTAGILDRELVKNGLVTANLEHDGQRTFWQQWAGHPRHQDRLWFIPLEIVFRLQVAPGSSYLRRHPESEIGSRLEPLVIEFWTKRERMDRLLETPEAVALVQAYWGKDSAMVTAVIDQVSEAARQGAKVLAQKFSKSGFELWDGKFECAWDSQSAQVVLVDLITLDEIRITKSGQTSPPWSKELVREHLRLDPWYKQLQVAKVEYGDKFAEFCPPPPIIAPETLAQWAQVYRHVALSLEGGGYEA